MLVLLQSIELLHKHALQLTKELEASEYALIDKNKDIQDLKTQLTKLRSELSNYVDYYNNVKEIIKDKQGDKYARISLLEVLPF